MIAFPEGTTSTDVPLRTGIRMRYYARGQGDVVLFLHGFPELALSWRDQLALPGVRCVAPDMRGYGGTDAPRRRRDYTMPILVNDILSLIELLGGRVHLVGHDWGGAVAWEVARAAPDRVRTLSILNCPPSEMMRHELIVNPRQTRMSWYMAAFQLPWLPERMFEKDPAGFLLSMFRYRGTPFAKALFTRESIAPYTEAHVRTRLAGYFYYRAALLAFMPKQTTPLPMPVQVVWGAKDAALGTWFMREERYTPLATRFRLVPIDDAGHWVQQERPDAVNRALAEWIAQ